MSESALEVTMTNSCGSICKPKNTWGIYEKNENILEQEERCYVLGDSGCTPSPTLLTPVLNAQEGSPASMYTGEHVGMRRFVEQSIGILTNSWMATKRCRKLYYAPEAVARIINPA